MIYETFFIAYFRAKNFTFINVRKAETHTCKSFDVQFIKPHIQTHLQKHTH